MTHSPITSWQINGETMETVTLFSWAPKSLQMVTAAINLKDTCSLEANLWPPQCKWKSLSHIRLFETPWTIQSCNSSGQNSEVGSHSILQGIFPTQGLNPGFPHCRKILYQPQGKPKNTGVGSLCLLQWIFLTRNGARVSCTAGRFFSNWAIRVQPTSRGY